MKPDKQRMLDSMKVLLTELAEECKVLSLQVMASNKGINDKVSKNTLIGSKIYNELETQTNGIDLIQILVNDYIEYIQGGMKTGHWVNEKIIIDWMQEKGLPYQDNKIVRAVQSSIYWYGITPRPIFEVSPYGEWKPSVNGHDGLVLDLIDKQWDEWAEELFEVSTEFLDEFFSEL